MSTLRICVGDFDFDATQYMLPEENAVWWIMWLATVLLGNMIFLNFIIAEASASYENVVSNLKAMQNREKALMIQDCELVLPQAIKTA